MAKNPKKISVPAGHALLRHADANASCTVDGVPYALEDGAVIVPLGVVEELASHGFYPDGTDVEQEQAEEPAPAEATAEQPAEAETAAGA